MNSLEKIENELKKDIRKKYKSDYFVPSLWCDPDNPPESKENVNPYRFYSDIIRKIRESETEISDQENPIVYNMFVRYSSAYSHSGKDNIVTEVDEDNKIRETGTFLKAIAMLPYIKSLGCDIIYLLPVTSVGYDGRKGNLGSPYAIKNPMKIDESLADPLIDLSAEVQLKAFIEATHLMGMKVVLEFVFRTASIDSDLALTNPEWFYWIKANVKDRMPGSSLESQYGPPIFTKKELISIKEKVEAGIFLRLPTPHDKHIRLFTATPKKVARVEGKIRGVIDNKEVRLPGAFADWPPDDLQPPWSDVTYLKMYDHPNYNYIAYNTVRIYDEKLTNKKNINEDLWNYIKGIIPHYQEKYDIDGVMVDMGHAMPSELMADIINYARGNNPDFIFWEENFHLSDIAIKNGYNASFGYLPFDQHDPDKMMGLIYRFANNDVPVKFFATPESHNTLRAKMQHDNINYLKAAFAMNAFLPTILFIHSGFELSENVPVNTGLGFSSEQQEKFPPEKLPLFSSISMNWDTDQDIIRWMKKIIKIRNHYSDKLSIDLRNSIEVPEFTGSNVVIFNRKSIDESFKLLIIVSYVAENEIVISGLDQFKKYEDLLSGEEVIIKDKELNMILNQFEIRILKTV